MVMINYLEFIELWKRNARVQKLGQVVFCPFISCPSSTCWLLQFLFWDSTNSRGKNRDCLWLKETICLRYIQFSCPMGNAKILRKILEF